MRRASATGLAIVVVACGARGPSSTPARGSGPAANSDAGRASAVRAAGPTDPGDAAAPSPMAPVGAERPGLSALGFASPPRVRGPIVARGYPHPIFQGMNDPATVVGFTRDGAELGYCAAIEARDPPSSWCETIDRGGLLHKRASDDAEGHFVASRKRELDAWIASSGLARITGARESMTGPPLAGTWAFPDVEVHVLRVAPTIDDRGDVQHPAFLRVGGAVGGEPPVYPVQLVTPELHGGAHFAVMNALALSPDGEELGMVGHFFACEWCDAWVVRRMPAGVFASLVYNDLGMRHHANKQWEKAAAAFMKSTFADPAAKLPPYNLACALARRGDEDGARRALSYALGLDPGAAERARVDADFASVRDRPWFSALVR